MNQTSPLRSVWILDDDSSIRWVLEKAFKNAGWQVSLFEEAEPFLSRLNEINPNRGLPDLVLSDVRMPGTDGMEVLEKIQSHYPQLPVVIMTAHSDLDSAVNAYKGGAFEYLPKPFDLDEVLAVAERAVMPAKNPNDNSGDTGASADDGMIGEAPAMQEVFRAIGRLSRSSVSVLLTGASGTGKELVARALHQHSSRAEQPFVALNMAAIPNELIESELFGHEKGAFTGALQRRAGRFKQADGGTLFLDEIGDMPLAVQTRLLRVLAEGQFYPVGSHQLVSADVRIIAATHQNLQQAVKEGRFREDLYHRLNVIHLRLPELAKRREDIPALAEHFLRLSAQELDMPVKRLTRRATEKLQQAPWPGNVRQLENTCRWITVMASSDVVDTDELPADLMVDEEQGEQPDENFRGQLTQRLREALSGSDNTQFGELMTEIEQKAIEIALEQTGGHKQEAAERLGWGRNTLTRKLKQSKRIE